MNTERAENLIQVVIMLAIGAMAGAASFTHVHDVTVAHGQPDWIGWANAVVVELMSIALGLELRRRARTGRPTGFVVAALLFFVAVSLAAQVVDAQRSIIGWLAAALPAIGFLVLAKVVLSRTSATTRPDPATEPAGPDPATVPTIKPATEPADPVVLVDGHTDPSPAEPVSHQQPVEPVAVPTHLLPTARFAVVNHEQSTGRAITAGELAARMSITPAVAGQLLHTITGTDNTAVVDAPGTRINGTHLGMPA